MDAFSIARDSDRPILLHVSTQKGKGYEFAEKHPERWHGTSPFDITTGEPLGQSGKPSYSDVFGITLERIASRNEKIVAITAAMAAGTGLSRFAAAFPERFFDVGMSEEHAVVFAAGLAAEGLVPVFAVYSTFAQRAVDYIIHDVCLQNLPVIFCLDRAGIVGDDGPTHHGIFDIALLRPVPGLIIMQPKDEAELAHMLFTATRLGKPVVIRYPRGAGPGVAVPEEYRELEIGRAEVLREGRDVQLWALGDMIPIALEAADSLGASGHAAGVVNTRFARPLDLDLLKKQSAARVVATLENGMVTGGFGQGVEDSLRQAGFTGHVLKFGWPDAFIPHGAKQSLMARFGLTPDAVVKTIQGVLSGEKKETSPAAGPARKTKETRTREKRRRRFSARSKTGLSVHSSGYQHADD
jgi:1-deoxy-D-xylulose-5-phosphate synthase